MADKKKKATPQPPLDLDDTNLPPTSPADPLAGFEDYYPDPEPEPLHKSPWWTAWHCPWCRQEVPEDVYRRVRIPNYCELVVREARWARRRRRRWNKSTT